MLGAGDADIQQAALFFNSAFGDRRFVRKRAVINANDVHLVELQTFGGMQRHQAHGVFVFIFFAAQRYLHQHRIQRFDAAAFGEVFHPADKIIQQLFASLK